MTAHLLDSLYEAAKLAIAHDNLPGEIIPSEWAKTYRCSEADVIDALHIAENGKRKLPEEIAATAPKAISREDDPE